MQIIDRILDFILGAKMVGVEDARDSFNQALLECDVDKDGYLSLRELINIFKRLIK